MSNSMQPHYATASAFSGSHLCNHSKGLSKHQCATTQVAHYVAMVNGVGSLSRRRDEQCPSLHRLGVDFIESFLPIATFPAPPFPTDRKAFCTNTHGRTSIQNLLPEHIGGENIDKTAIQRLSDDIRALIGANSPPAFRLEFALDFLANRNVDDIDRLIAYGKFSIGGKSAGKRHNKTDSRYPSPGAGYFQTFVKRVAKIQNVKFPTKNINLMSQSLHLY